MENKHEVYVYAVRHRARKTELLVARPGHEKASGVACGEIAREEAPAEAALRHLREQTGLGQGLGRVWIVYADWIHPENASTPGKVRYFYGVEVDEARARWQHVATGGAQDGVLMECYFMPLPLGTALSQGGEYVGEL